jgi:hypothetical protein
MSRPAGGGVRPGQPVRCGPPVCEGGEPDGVRGRDQRRLVYAGIPLAGRSQNVREPLGRLRRVSPGGGPSRGGARPSCPARTRDCAGDRWRCEDLGGPSGDGVHPIRRSGAGASATRCPPAAAPMAGDRGGPDRHDAGGTASLMTHTLDERHNVSSATTVWLTAMYPVVIDPPINAEVALVLFRGGSLVTLHCTYQARTGPVDLPVRKTLGLLIFGRSSSSTTSPDSRPARPAR